MSISAITKQAALRQMKICRRPGTAAELITGANFDIFTINGDAIVVLNLWGICTTLIAGAIVPQFSFTPTGGAAIGLSAAMLSLDTDVAGTVYVWDGVTATVPGPATQIGYADSAEAGWNGDPGILPAGVIRIVNAVASTAGVIDWYIAYIPCSNASQVVPA